MIIIRKLSIELFQANNHRNDDKKLMKTLFLLTNFFVLLSRLQLASVQPMCKFNNAHLLSGRAVYARPETDDFAVGHRQPDCWLGQFECTHEWSHRPQNIDLLCVDVVFQFDSWHFFGVADTSGSAGYIHGGGECWRQEVGEFVGQFVGFGQVSLCQRVSRV
jgi:hypothetical protein